MTTSIEKHPIRYLIRLIAETSVAIGSTILIGYKLLYDPSIMSSVDGLILAMLLILVCRRSTDENDAD